MRFTITDEEFGIFSQLVNEPEQARGIYKFKTRHRIAKIAPEKQNIFGWASIGAAPDGTLITDHQGDVIYPEDLEDAAYDFTLYCRDGGTMHVGQGGKSSLIESFVSTPDKCQAMGIPAGTLPIGWWTGFHVHDSDAWMGVKKGIYREFSVQGIGKRTPIHR